MLLLLFLKNIDKYICIFSKELITSSSNSSDFPTKAHVFNWGIHSGSKYITMFFAYLHEMLKNWNRKKDWKKQDSQIYLRKEELNILNPTKTVKRKILRRKKHWQEGKYKKAHVGQVYIQEKEKTYTTKLFKITNIIFAYTKSNVIRKHLSKGNHTKDQHQSRGCSAQRAHRIMKVSPRGLSPKDPEQFRAFKYSTRLFKFAEQLIQQGRPFILIKDVMFINAKFPKRKHMVPLENLHIYNSAK